MARPIWTGSLSFGLVNVPVALFAATEDKTVHFHQLEEGTADRVRNKRVNERTGAEVDYARIVKGYDAGDGQYVVVSAEELDGVAPEASKTIAIEDFVDERQIDPIFYQRSYFLAPQTPEARRAYGLLRRAMSDAGRVGVSRFVLRGKEHLAAVRPGDDVLVLETMFHADEIRDAREEVEGLPIEESFNDRELKTAVMLVDSMTTDWEPDRYRDAYRDKLLELLERKRRGEEVVFERPRPAAPLGDLMEALAASVEAAKDGKRRGSPSAPSGRAPGLRPAAKRSGPGQGDELEALTKAELLRRAAALEVAGRSRMTHGELVGAVRDAQRPAARRQAS